MILEDRGFFWWSDEPIPDRRFAPDSAVSGYLAIADDGAVRLELDGFLADPRGPFVVFFSGDDPAVRARRIQGILKATGKHVLLLGLWRAGGEASSYKISYERYFALSRLVSDYGFSNSVKSLKCLKLEIDLKGFEAWLQLASIELNRRKNLVSAKYRHPKEINYKIGEDSISIRSDISVPILSGTVREHSVNINETVSLVYTPRKSLTIPEMQRLYDLIQDLFILLTGSEYRLDWPLVHLGRKRQRFRFYFYNITSPAAPPSAGELWTYFPQLRPTSGLYSLYG